MCFVVPRLLRELQGEGSLTADQGLRVKEWLCSVEEERSGLTTASGPDSGIDNGSTEDGVGGLRKPGGKHPVLQTHCSAPSQRLTFSAISSA